MAEAANHEWVKPKGWDRVRPALVMAAAAFRADPVRAVLAMTFDFASSLGGPLFAWFLGKLADAALSGGDLRVPVIGMATSVAASLTLWQVGMQMRATLEERTSHYVDRHIAEMSAGLPGIEHHERPDFLNKIERIKNEFWLYSMSVSALLMNLALVVQMVATVAVLASIDPRLWIVPVFALPSLLANAKAERIRLRAVADRGEQYRKTEHLLDLVQQPASAKELRVFGLGSEVLGRHRQVWDEVAANELRHRLQGARYIAAARVVFAVGYAGAVLLVAQRAAAGDITVGRVLLAVTLCGQIMTQLNQAGDRAAWLAWTLTAVRNYVWLLDYARDAWGRANRPGGARPAPDRIEHGIRFEDVTFRYPATDRDVLTGVNLFLPAGSIVAIVGDNGAGKSTLVKLLCRFYEPAAGQVTIDGVDLADIDVEQWRLRTAASFQDHAKLELMTQEAVGVGDLPRIDDAEAAVVAVKRANADDVLADLPSGLGSQLGASWDDGVDLSGGQWQKLALARGMMRDDPLLLVLDEPTAALDADTEHAMFEQYAKAAREGGRERGAITVLVSHRFSTVRMADIILVIGDGAVVEAGSHDELMNAAGLYAELYEMQARAYR